MKVGLRSFFFAFQRPQQGPVKILHFLSLPAVLRDARQAVRRHPGPPGHLHPGDRGAADTGPTLVGVLLVPVGVPIVCGPVGGPPQPGDRHEEVHGRH